MHAAVLNIRRVHTTVGLGLRQGLAPPCCSEIVDRLTDEVRLIKMFADDVIYSEGTEEVEVCSGEK